MMTITTVPYSKLLAKLARNANATPDHQCASNLRDQDIDFNHSIFCDVMYIDGKPVLHVVDGATRFQAARWLQNMSSETVWEALRACWIDTYLGTPDMISHDAGTNFTSAEFNQYAQSLGISLKEVPVEAANSMGIVERFHQPLRRAFQIISEEVRSNDRILILQMAVKAINDTAGPDGIVPTLLVFGAYPRLTVLDGPAPSIAARAKAIKKAMSEVNKLRAQRQVATALVTRNGPVTEDIPIGSQVLVRRTHQKKWDGCFKLLAMLAETATIELPSGPTQFRSTAVNKFTPAEENNQDAAEPIPTTPEQRLQRERRLPSRYRDADIVVMLTEPLSDFEGSRSKELDGLIRRGVFQCIETSEIPQEARLFSSRFVDKVKLVGTPQEFEKSRLVVQAYNDDGKKEILTQAPTVQRASQRLLLAVAAMRGLQVYARDISQAYLQSKSMLSRDFFVRPPPELKLTRSIMLKVLRPLYGITEAGNHWFWTYHKHHIEKLKLTQSASDPCLLFNEEAIVALQIDDTLFACVDTYLQREKQELQKAGFVASEPISLYSLGKLTFNGAKVTLYPEGTISITPNDQCDKIELVKPDTKDTNAQYVSQRARRAYVASVCQPQATCALSQAAQTTSPNTEDIKRLNNCLKWQSENKTTGITFFKLDEQSLQLVVFTDASFANNADLSSQIGFLIILADKNNNCNAIHWSSTKCKRITRSVLAAELYAMANGFDAARVLKHTIDGITKSNVPLKICVDSYSLYEFLVKLGTTREKRLMIDILAIRQAYERREITEIVWIEGIANPADSLTKTEGNTSLAGVISTNKITIVEKAWVERGNGIQEQLSQ